MQRPGKLLLVIGPSGAGKDTLVQCARRALPPASPLQIIEREITRPLGANEHHISVTDAEFQQRLATGQYLLNWAAHGVHYGIPQRARTVLEHGHSVLSICSRAILPAARMLNYEVHFIEVRAPYAILQQRLHARGGRPGSEIAGRLARADSFAPEGLDVHALDNSGALADSAAAFLTLLTNLAGIVAWSEI